MWQNAVSFPCMPIAGLQTKAGARPKTALGICTGWLQLGSRANSTAWPFEAWQCVRFGSRISSLFSAVQRCENLLMALDWCWISSVYIGLQREAGRFSGCWCALGGHWNKGLFHMCSTKEVSFPCVNDFLVNTNKLCSSVVSICSIYLSCTV